MSEPQEIRYNLMETYKKPWNNHVAGEGCWCNPILTQNAGFLVHRNYVWSDADNRWHPIQEGAAP